MGDFFIEDGVIGVMAVVGRETREHFKDKYTEGVPVYAFVVAMLDDDLGSVMSASVPMNVLGKHTSGER